MERMICSECDHVERDPIGLDTETCLSCGGNLELFEDSFDDDDGFTDPENIYNLPGIRQSIEEDRK